MHQPSPEHIV